MVFIGWLLFGGGLLVFYCLWHYEKQTSGDTIGYLQGRVHELEQSVNTLSLELQKERNKPPTYVYSRPSTRACKKKGRRHPHPKYANRGRKKGASRYYD